RSWRGEVRSDLEQIRLHAMKLRIDRRFRPGRSRQADEGVQLVDGAVGFDARIVFRDATAAEQRRFSAIAGARVDFHSRLPGLVVSRSRSDTPRPRNFATSLLRFELPD